MTQYIVTNSKTGDTVTVEAQSRDHARLIARLTNAEAFTDGKDGVWLHTEEVRDAAARFRQTLAVQDLMSDRIEELLDLFQEALDEATERSARDAAYPYN